MNKQDWIRKDRLVTMMSITARYHGKDSDRLHIINVADRLHRLETTLHRLAEEECMYPNYDEAKQERLENLSYKILKEELGCESRTQRDPRGCMIRMFLVNEDGDRWSNSWDGETAVFDY